MKQDQDAIENACAAVASALAELVTAITARTAAKKGAGAARGRSEAALRLAIEGMAADGAAEFDDQAKSGRRVYVYMAGSRGCATLARTYGVGIMAALGLEKAPYVIMCGTTSVASRSGCARSVGTGMARRCARGTASRSRPDSMRGSRTRSRPRARRVIRRSRRGLG